MTAVLVVAQFSSLEIEFESRMESEGHVPTGGF